MAQEAFNLYDQKKSGSIAVNDLGPVMRQLGQTLSEVELKQMSAGGTRSRTGAARCAGSGGGGGATRVRSG